MADGFGKGKLLISCHLGGKEDVREGGVGEAAIYPGVLQEDPLGVQFGSSGMSCVLHILIGPREHKSDKDMCLLLGGHKMVRRSTHSHRAM